MKKISLLSLSFALAAAACAYKPTAELVRAQEAYRHASNGPTSEIAQAELHQAKTALDSAAAADKNDPGSEEGKDLAYVAERKADWAAAQASTKIAQRNKIVAEQRLVDDQGKMLNNQRRQLTAQEQRIEQEQRTRAEQLSAKDSELSEKDRQLMSAKNSAAEAQALASAAAEREREALEKLKASEDARGQVITLPSSLMFRTNQSVLLVSARPKLDEVASALKKMPDRTLLIEGHTDAVGSEEKNIELSERRAKAVRDYLVSKGVPGERVTTQGVGKSRPIADNSTTEGRALNRRVEIVIQKSNDQGTATR
jgi:outer membrane protein OmpA-like peptidoglycan-associated protein